MSRNELTQVDKEASKILDMTLWDVITETNQLNDVQVCFMCHRNCNLFPAKAGYGGIYGTRV